MQVRAFGKIYPLKLSVISSPQSLRLRWPNNGKYTVTKYTVIGYTNDSVRPSSVRPSTFSNIFSCETTGPTELKFHMETP